MWKKKNMSCETIEDVVLSNTGLTKEELLDEGKKYEVPAFNKVKDVLLEAAKRQTLITVVGDYDADGICATSEMKLLCDELSIPVKTRLPKRFKEGYGLKESIIDEIDEGIVFTVDNGIVAFDAIDKAKKKGLYVIVTDHHQGDKSGKLPNADIVVDPSFLQDGADFTKYCGAGLVYKLAETILEKDNKTLQMIKGLAAIASVCDVVPLNGDNRQIVRDGIKNLLNYQTRTVGTGALLRAMGSTRGLTSTDIAFGIGPALNACGRLEGTTVAISQNSYKPESEYSIVADASMAINLLTGKYKSLNEADEKAREVKLVNEQRKILKREQYNEIQQVIKDEMLYADNPLVVYKPGLHEGIVGILAGNLVEDYGVPAIVLTDDARNPLHIKGSARSISEIDLKKLLDSVSDDLVQYGGHPGAAGLSLERAKLADFREHLIEKLYDVDIKRKEKTYDLEIIEDDVESLIDEIEKWGPFGEGNPEPLFLIRNFKPFPLERTSELFKYVGHEHVILQGKYVKAPAFFLREKFEELEKNIKYLDVIGTIGWSWDIYGNQIPTFFITDLQKAENPPKLKRTSLFKQMQDETDRKGIKKA